jgi:predicted GNAT superfamily acetyltransferase
MRKRKPLRYEQLIAGRALLVNEASFNEEGLAVPADDFTESERSLILVEIPANFQRLKARDMDLARRWRAHTRRIFEHYFAHQYIVTDFARRQDEEGRDRAYYVMTYQHA